MNPTEVGDSWVAALPRYHTAATPTPPSPGDVWDESLFSTSHTKLLQPRGGSGGSSTTTTTAGVPAQARDGVTYARTAPSQRRTSLEVKGSVPESKPRPRRSWFAEWLRPRDELRRTLRRTSTSAVPDAARAPPRWDAPPVRTYTGRPIATAVPAASADDSGTTAFGAGDDDVSTPTVMYTSPDPAQAPVDAWEAPAGQVAASAACSVPNTGTEACGHGASTAPTSYDTNAALEPPHALCAHPYPDTDPSWWDPKYAEHVPIVRAAFGAVPAHASPHLPRTPRHWSLPAGGAEAARTAHALAPPIGGVAGHAAPPFLPRLLGVPEADTSAVSVAESAASAPLPRTRSALPASGAFKWRAPGALSMRRGSGPLPPIRPPPQSGLPPVPGARLAPQRVRSVQHSAASVHERYGFAV